MDPTASSKVLRGLSREFAALLATFVLAVAILLNLAIAWPFAISILIVWFLWGLKNRYAKAIFPIACSTAAGTGIAWIIASAMPIWMLGDRPQIADSLRQYDSLIAQLQCSLTALDTSALFWVILLFVGCFGSYYLGTSGIVQRLTAFRLSLTCTLVFFSCISTLKIYERGRASDLLTDLQTSKDQLAERINDYEAERANLEAEIRFALEANLESETLLASAAALLEKTREVDWSSSDARKVLLSARKEIDRRGLSCDLPRPPLDGWQAACDLFSASDYATYSSRDRVSRVQALMEMLRGNQKDIRQHLSADRQPFPRAPSLPHVTDASSIEEIDSAERALGTRKQHLENLMLRNHATEVILTDSMEALDASIREVVPPTLLLEGWHLIVSEGVKSIVGELAVELLKDFYARRESPDRSSITKEADKLAAAIGGRGLGERLTVKVKRITSDLIASIPRATEQVEKRIEYAKRLSALHAAFEQARDKPHSNGSLVAALLSMGSLSPDEAWARLNSDMPATPYDGDILSRQIALRWLAAKEGKSTPTSYAVWHQDLQAKSRIRIETKNALLRKLWQDEQRRIARETAARAATHGRKSRGR